MEKSYKIAICTFAILMVLSAIFGLWNYTVYLIPPVFLLIFLGIFCFKNQVLKPIYISLIAGLVLSIPVLFLVMFLLSLLSPGSGGASDAIGGAAFLNILGLPAILATISTSLIIGLLISYNKSKNKIVFGFLILAVIVLLVIIMQFIYRIMLR